MDTCRECGATSEGDEHLKPAELSLCARCRPPVTGVAILASCQIGVGIFKVREPDGRVWNMLNAKLDPSYPSRPA